MKIVEYLKHRDKCPQERIKVFSVALLVAILIFLAEFAPEEVHTEDAERYHAIPLDNTVTALLNNLT